MAWNSDVQEALGLTDEEMQGLYDALVRSEKIAKSIQELPDDDPTILTRAKEELLPSIHEVRAYFPGVGLRPPHADA